MATIYDVARLANVSITTVSKVLSNTPYVSARSKQRVQEAMRQLNYSPNLAARGLSNKHTYVIGLIVPSDPDTSFHDPFLLEIIRGVESTANTNDYNVLLSMSKQTNRRSAYRRFLHTGYIDGLVTVETYQGEINDKELDEHGIPRVSAGYREDLRPINTVHCDDRLGAYQAVSYLLSLGHRRIGIISGPKNFVVAIEARLQGVREALAEGGAEFDQRLVSYGDFTTESGYRAAQALLTLPERPSAIFAMNDRMAVGAMRYAREQGLRIPEDLSLIGFDDVPLTTIVEPPLTTIRQFPNMIGKTAADRLFALINGELETFPTIVLPVELVVRGTTRKCV